MEWQHIVESIPKEALEYFIMAGIEEDEMLRQCYAQAML
jgi:hypothetical protein